MIRNIGLNGIAQVAARIYSRKWVIVAVLIYPLAIWLILSDVAAMFARV